MNFEQWWTELGPMTKFTLLSSISLTAAVSYGVVPKESLTIDLYATFVQLQVWRLVTASFFLGTFSMGWLFGLAMLVIYMKYNEDFDFKGRLADLVWMLVMIVAFLHLVGYVLGFPWAGLTMPLCWVFCKRHPTMQMKLYFFVFSANIFPWVLCAFHVVTGGSLALDLAGIVAGHAYLFLADVLPKTHGKELATTPQFLLRWFPRQNQALAGVHMPTRMRAEQQAAAAQPPRHNWGAGRVLGAQ